MERKIGETFDFEGKTLQVKESERVCCDGCFFDGKCYSSRQEVAGHCEAVNRGDNKEIIFVEVREQQQDEQPQDEQPQETEEIKERKVGEVFEYQGKKLRVEEIKNGGCDGCFFDGQLPSFCNKLTLAGHCESEYRTDKKEVIFVEITEEQLQEQPQELNLCEILKYCPDGETFWSPMLGDVKLYDINQEAKMVDVKLENGETWNFNSDGTISFGGTTTSPEIMLYPSREQRDWMQVKYEKKLPKTWEEFCKNYPRKKDEAYLDLGSQIFIFPQDYEYRTEDTDKNILPSKQAAEAHLALMQLHQLRDAWREGWLPDWEDGGQNKYVIAPDKGEFEIWQYHTVSRFLAFQDEKRADEFKDCFIDLIRKAGDLI